MFIYYRIIINLRKRCREKHDVATCSTHVVMMWTACFVSHALFKNNNNNNNITK